ncbi:MAG: PIG-L deacetylase family protein [Promethearchaeota archaeon]
MKKIIFFQAHPDDLEFNCFHLLSYLCNRSRQTYDIKIASATRGEYGWPKHAEHFKGERLGRLRTKELFNAMATYGITPEKIHFFEIIDGYVFFNQETVELVREYLNQEKPDIIFACEPRNTYYRHPDHINIGKAVFYVLNKELVDFTPKLYFYSSINPNFFWPIKSEDIPKAQANMRVHASQMHIWNSIGRLYKFIMLQQGKGVDGTKYAEGYRRVFFHYNRPKRREKMRFRHRLLLRLCVKAWPEKVTRH